MPPCQALLYFLDEGPGRDSSNERHELPLDEKRLLIGFTHYQTPTSAAPSEYEQIHRHTSKNSGQPVASSACNFQIINNQLPVMFGRELDGGDPAESRRIDDWYQIRQRYFVPRNQ